MFKESKYPIKKIAFWFLIIASIIAMFKVFFMTKNFVKVPVFGTVFQETKVTMELDNKINKNPFMFCFDDNCYPAENDVFYNQYHSAIGPSIDSSAIIPFKKIYLAYPKEQDKHIDNIKSVYINIGVKDYYLGKDEIKNLNKKEVKLKFNADEKEKVYSVLEISDKGNMKPFISQVAIFLMSLFYSWNLYIFSYVWLALAFLIYIFNKDKINLKINITSKFHYVVLGLIIFLGAFLRITELDLYPFWTDEVYTSAVALKSFKNCFMDPGNPPFFFIIEFIFSKIFGNSVLSLRFLPCVFGIFLIPVVYMLFKKIGKNVALFASFFVAINSINIYHSQEARAYSFDMLLVVLLIYTLFSFLNKPTLKRLVVYSIFAAIAINTSYYLAIFVFVNFIWAVVDLIQNKNNKFILKLFIAHFICGLTFLPYLIISLNGALAQGFNGWIPPLTDRLVYFTIKEYFLNKYIFISLCLFLFFNLVLCFIPEKILSKFAIKIDKNKENLFIYLVYSLVLILIIACAVSIFIKPIFHKRVLLSIYALLMMLECCVIFSVIRFEKITKFISCLKFVYVSALLLICFSITKPMPCKLDCNLQHFMNFVSKDLKYYEDKYEIHIITCDTIDYINYYPELKNNKKIIWHFIDTNSGKVIKDIRKEDYIAKNKKAIIYFNSIGINTKKVLNYNSTATSYRDNLTSFARLKFD